MFHRTTKRLSGFRIPQPGGQIPAGRQNGSAIGRKVHHGNSAPVFHADRVKLGLPAGQIGSDKVLKSRILMGCKL
jgi:hypothetical protein